VKRMTDKQKKHLMRKARQLAAADISRRAGEDPTTREAVLKMVVGKDSLMFQPRTGYFAPRTGPMYSMSDLDVAEALDNPGHMVQVCAKLGFSMLAQVLRYTKPAPGQQALKDLAEVAAKMMKLDVEALRAELAAERAEAADEAAKAVEATPVVPITPEEREGLIQEGA
jgi:hypothetical protein